MFEWILIIMISSGSNGGAFIREIRWFSKDACITAAAEVKKSKAITNLEAHCVKANS